MKTNIIKNNQKTKGKKGVFLFVIFAAFFMLNPIASASISQAFDSMNTAASDAGKGILGVMKIAALIPACAALFMWIRGKGNDMIWVCLAGSIALASAEAIVTAFTG